MVVRDEALAASNSAGPGTPRYGSALEVISTVYVSTSGAPPLPQLGFQVPDRARKGPYPWLIAGVLLVPQASSDGLGLARTD
ncbi:hypothetical protein [Myxococcus fulvus]|uniref:hypothetical protein n=1 Tax=Myxococcus fulvus TaxID=33 RepID=UPI0020BE63D9|nr:hypothetical protein [Myxococcus fulvus]MCK8501868.1 hypothetical protein [Myxococcus fulvus]